MREPGSQAVPARSGSACSLTSPSAERQSTIGSENSSTSTVPSPICQKARILIARCCSANPSPPHSLAVCHTPTRVAQTTARQRFGRPRRIRSGQQGWYWIW
jgi:hypothetical protein